MRLLHLAMIAAMASACSSKTKAVVTEEAFQNRETRREMLEATLRVLDKNPKYVDELFEISLRHRGTLDRFLANHARGLAKKDLAERTAAHLVDHPAGLENVMIATLDAAQGKPEAQEAIVDAMKARKAVAMKTFVNQLTD